MDVDQALVELPHPYAVALRLDQAGRPPTEIAIALGIADDAVPMVLRLGRDKLARLLQPPEGRPSADPTLGAPTPDEPGGDPHR